MHGEIERLLFRICKIFLQFYHFITQLCCLLEIQVCSSLAHLFSNWEISSSALFCSWIPDPSSASLQFQQLPWKLQSDHGLLLNSSRSNSMLLIIGFLDFPATVGFLNGISHGIRHHVCIHDNVSFAVSGSTANGLDQGSLRTKEALLVCIQNSNQSDLRNIKVLLAEG